MQWLGPLETEPVSVYAPFTSCPGGRYRPETAEECRAAVRAAVRGIELGVYDQRMVTWLGGWDVPTVAGVVSLLGRARQAGAEQARRGGGECGG
jgi:hypothetical protein